MRSKDQRDSRRILADELYWAIKQDKDLCEEILDEYTYLLSDSRVDELTETLEKNFLDDDDTHFIVK
tara:strand:+ start:314 stop:514 length:201 start_codon:yes stop_codon:yes gene_type:complete